MAFQLPESLDGLTVDELDALTDEARTELAAVDLSDDATDEDIAQAESLADAIATLAEAHEVATTKASERADRLAKAREAAKATEAPAETKDEVEDATPEPEAADDPEVIAPDEVDGQPVEAADETEKEPVLADARTPVQRAADAALPVDFAPAKAAVALTAAADVPGFATGSQLEGLDDVVKAIMSRVKAMPKHNMASERGGVRQRFGAAVVTAEFDDDRLIQSGKDADDLALVQYAGDENRLGQALTAAGWCAPSETMYDLCEFESVEGMLDVPEFQVRRAGIRFTQGPRFDQIYNNLDADGNAKAAKDHWDFEVQEDDPDAPTKFNISTSPYTRDAAGSAGGPNTATALTEKPCAMVDCYPWEEIRLACLGYCVKSPILLEMSYPELVRRFLEGVLVGHKHHMNSYKIAQIAAAAGTPVDVTAATPKRTIFNLAAIEYQAIAMRWRFRLPLERTMEIVAPAWLREVIRMDIAMENDRDSRCVTNAEIDGWFTCRNMRVQWVYDWQDISVDAATNKITFPNMGGGAAGAAAPGDNPTHVRLLMYPAGSWAAGIGDSFSIDAVYDAASLADNVYTAAFMEECLLMVNRCYDTVALDVELCASGTGVLDVASACLVP